MSESDLYFQMQFLNVLCPVKSAQNTSLEKQNKTKHLVTEQPIKVFLCPVKVAVDCHSDASADSFFGMRLIDCLKASHFCPRSEWQANCREVGCSKAEPMVEQVEE